MDGHRFFSPMVRKSKLEGIGLRQEGKKYIEELRSTFLHTQVGGYMFTLDNSETGPLADRFRAEQTSPCTLTLSHTQGTIYLQSYTSLEYGKKLEYSEKTHVVIGRTYKFSDRQHP